MPRYTALAVCRSTLTDGFWEGLQHRVLSGSGWGNWVRPVGALPELAGLMNPSQAPGDRRGSVRRT